MEDEDMVKTNVDYLVTQTTLDPRLPVDTVVTVLRKRKTTGKLTFDLSQGSVQRVELTEKTKADGLKSRKVRDVLGMD